jgi:hypothetical protein
MSNKGINNILLHGARKVWGSDFTGAQAWTTTEVATGGYGGWSAGSGYHPRIASSRIEWSSTGYWYYGYTVTKFTTTTANLITPGIIEGAMYGNFSTSYHSQSASYNILCSSEGYAGSQQFVRNTNGLSFSVCASGGYWDNTTRCNIYLDGVYLGSTNYLSTANTTYTMKFKLVGMTLYACLNAGDTRSTVSTYSTISTSVNQATLTGRETIIWYYGSSTNDQGQYLGGQIYSASLNNYS